MQVKIKDSLDILQINFSFYNSSIFENEMCYKLIHMKKFEMESLVHNLPVYRAGESFKKIL